MEALIDIAHWYASPLGTFIWMYNVKKALHILTKFSMDKLVMQEVSYHISIGLLDRLHRKKKAPWPALPLRIELYEIQNLKHAEAEREEFKRFTFSTRSFNPYDLYCLVKDHYARVQFPWIHGACHWPKEDPWLLSLLKAQSTNRNGYRVVRKVDGSNISERNMININRG